MNKWQATFLGLKQLPRELSGFEIEAFFTFTLAERQMIEDRRPAGAEAGVGAADWLSAHEWPVARCGTHRAARTLAASARPRSPPCLPSY